MKVPWIHILRVLALTALGLSGLILYDFTAPPSGFEEVRISHKSHHRGKSGTTYNLHTAGGRSLSESVPRDIHDLAQTGDTLRLKLTPMFLEWKEAELVRDHQVLARFHGKDLYFMGLFGGLFVLTLAAFLSREILMKYLYIPIVVGLLEFIAVGIWIAWLTDHL